MLDPKNPEKYFKVISKLKKDFKKQKKELTEKAKQNYVDTPAFFEKIHQQQLDLAISQSGIHYGLNNISKEWSHSKFKEQLQTQYQLSMNFFESNEENIKESSKKLQEITQAVSESPFNLKR